MTVGVRDPKSGKVAAAAASPARRSRCRSSAASVETVDGRKLGYVRLATFSEGAHALPAQGGRKGASAKGAEGIVLDLRGNGGGLLEEAVLTASIFLPEDEVVVIDRLAHPGPRRLRDRRRQPAGAADRRPDRPQHRLGGGDPHRRAGRRRRRRGGRHPLLRQGRLPAGGRPLQRRRAEADDRRVLHPGRRPTSPATGIQPDVQARDVPRTEPRRGARTRPRGAGGRSSEQARLAPAPGAAARRAAGAQAATPKTAREAVEALLARGARAARLPRLARGRSRRGRRGCAESPHAARAAT